ncbi:MAG TPA: alpha-glucuronidase family glycosyl hydrolase [Steroidobacteraceae bacterium]|nr:alpha-glucuronidase family glycosyl hydrolase [Steroidobacteraceae bacterium]
MIAVIRQMLINSARSGKSFFLCGVSVLVMTHTAYAEDGYDLWLRYRPVDSQWLQSYRQATTKIVLPVSSATLQAAKDELYRGLTGLLNAEPQFESSSEVATDGLLVVGTPKSLAGVKGLDLSRNIQLNKLGNEGYAIRSMSVNGHPVIVVIANTDIGALYGTFGLLRMMQTRQSLSKLDQVSVPDLQLRMLNHWDNLDRHVERGYAGQSIWDWHKLPDYIDPRYVDYARANASIGINAAVLTNVNAKAIVLTPMYLEKVAAIADTLRPYGIKVLLTARFTAPMEIGGLKTADPLNSEVQAWWKSKVDEIYQRIPDFGGFLVKANSEGQPGPQDYGRTQADGANMLAAPLAAHGGVVIWRAFVYSNEQPDDRAKQAYNEFVPLDGKFNDNVIVQVKNGAIDFQPREPFHPLFGAMPKTPLMMEFQITKEYLGFATHLVYLGPLYEEVLKSDTFSKGPGSTVAKVIDGSLYRYKHTGMAGVSNIGSDRNWSGSQFDQANWYVFGRLAWNPQLSSQDIAREWVRMTFTNDDNFVKPVVNMMMASREAVVDYMTPLGLHHMMGEGHHYGPGPWVSGGPRADWTSVYYNRAAADGIGFDRTSTGSNAVAQYFSPVAKQFENIKQTPEKYLLWFHHVAWDYKLQSGDTLWDGLVHHYDTGVKTVHDMRETWKSLSTYVDTQRFSEIDSFLAIQEKEAQWWRDACIAYFQTFSNRPLPAGSAAPTHSLDYYESLKFPYAPGR